MDKTPLEWKKLYDSADFRKNCTFEGELGPVCGKTGTRLSLWSPVSDTCTLRLYRDGERDTAPFATFPMTKNGQGVFVFETRENLDGTFYDFLLTRDGEEIVSGDPYAVACGANSVRCEIVDLETTNPSGWKSDRAPAHQTETIIWETHVRDFSFDRSGGFPENTRGKFAAFAEHGTKVQNSSSSASTGIDYLSQLGITHVQLMPVFDYATVDETGKDPALEYNWGYDPVYYNVPEGSYSSNPADGKARIRELKEAIASLHEAGLRVIMDVVYNHTLDLNNAMQQSMPDYYFRVTKEGQYANGSGCGNDAASEREMVGKFILDSVLYWAREYHFDGFRFDLMGLLPVGLMNRIQRSLDRVYGKGEKLVLGEPWAAGPSAPSRRVKLAAKANFGGMDRKIAMFCDNTRNMVAGSPFDDKDHGIVAHTVSCHAYRQALDDWEDAPDLPVSSPAQLVSYASCHDNYTLIDNIARGTKDPAEQLRRARLAPCIYMTCPGIAFLLSGEEFLRSKGGDGNSYRSPSSVNAIRWDQMEQNASMVTLYKELFTLRKKCPAFFGKGSRRRVLSADVTDRTLLARLDNAYRSSDMPEGYLGNFDAEQLREAKAFAGKYPELLILLNTDEKTHSFTLPEGAHHLLFTNLSGSTDPEKVSGDSAVPVDPCGFLVYGRVSNDSKSE